MSAMDRRDFVKTMVVGGAAVSLASAVWPSPLFASGKTGVDIGMCKGVTVTSVSEVGWWSTKQLMQELKAAGGPKKADQWQAKWDLNNGAGSCSLVEVEMLDGSRKRILLDVGWNPSYMAWRFQMTGVDKLLAEGKIDYLMLSHEHLDHIFGLEAALSLAPNIPMIIPSTFKPQGLAFLEGKSFPEQGANNRVRHKGKVMVMKPGGVHKLFDGAGVMVFGNPFILKLQGEESLVFNVKGKGLVLVTGCCHQGITTFADTVKTTVADGSNLYGLYGGLHIAPFGPLTPKGEAMVKAMGGYGFKKMACNHCTGLPAVEMMKKLKYPVVSGTGAQGSSSTLYVGNGDKVTFS